MADTLSSDLLHAVFEAAVDGIIVATKNGTVTPANAAAARLFGYDGPDLVGQSINILMPAHLAAKHDAFMQEHLSSGIDRIIGTIRPVAGLRRDGTAFPLQISVSKTESDGATAFVAIMHDLTDKRAVQQTHTRSHRHDAIVQMINGISHDFNNLVTVIMGNLELATLKVNDVLTQEMIANALDAAESCAELTNRLAQFARQGYFKPEANDISAACLSAKAQLDGLIGSHYTISCPPVLSAIHVNVDPNKLEGAIVNLVLNACDAMPQGGEIIIDTVIVPIDIDDLAQKIGVKRGVYACVSVKDCGTGMSTGAMLRAFEPFYTTKPTHNGTGFELSMVHGFARQSHGHVTLKSNLGHGSTVSIYLPIATDEPTPQKTAPKEITALKGGNQRVLVVKNNSNTRSLTCERVEALGYRALVADTADRALEILNEGYKIDALLTDLIAPNGRDGIDLALVARFNFPHLKIILTIGSEKEAIDKNKLLLAPLEILLKPYNQEDLAACLHSAFAGG